ncbi:MAG: electron transfer flavoprotein subunit alpha/FixB family protein [Peptococcaceae bacterium]|nr:electron transfer flavoprotein subunit alpha/FixB family protein [Peptococcaceae bacterium]
MSAMKNVWVFSEKQDLLVELCAGARQLGEKVAVLLIGNPSAADEAIKAGADHVYLMGELEDSRMVEDFLPTIEKLVAEHKPDLVMFGNTKRGKLMAGILAAKRGTSVLADVIEFLEDGTCKRRVYGGAAISTIKSNAEVAIATVGGGVFGTQALDESRQGTTENVDFVAAESKVKCVEKRAKAGATVNLSAAKRVVAVGRGFADKEDLKMAEELAELIGAEIGCTRPLSEGLDWLPRERYIGVSGVMFKPDLYITLGISGQIQHMVGCNQSQTIIAVNKDKAAPIFKQADYGIVGDLYKVLPMLIEKIKAGK